MTNNPSEKESAREANEQFPALDMAQMAVDSANVGIWILDVVSRNFLPSTRTKNLFGFLPEEEISFDDILRKVAGKNRSGVLTNIEEAIKGRRNLYVECPVMIPNEKTQRWLSITGGFSTSDLTNSFFCGIVVDITEQKKNDLRRSRFIGMVSHELKTPLTILKAYVQMLNKWAKKQNDSFTIGALSKVDKQVKKMLNMINSLLNLSGAEAGKIHLNKQEFDMDELITEVINETLFITSSHNIIITPGDSVRVNADRDKIGQVMANLLSNAAKYSDPEQDIEVSCAKDGNKLTVSIRDRGMGISPEDIEKLFLPHYRAETKETEKITGFGIGLYLCSEIIQRHQGKIWVESELGHGSTFNFSLPINM